MLLSPSSHLASTHLGHFSWLKGLSIQKETSNEADDIGSKNHESLEKLKNMIKHLTGKLHPFFRKSKSFCSYRGCINKIRMKKRNASPSTKYIEKMLRYYKQKITKLQKTPGLEGTKKILQVTSYYLISILN